MNFEQIAQKGVAIVRRRGTRDPFRIARDLGILVRYADDFVRLKGMYRVILKNRFIILNNRLSERMKRIVCAHEIGHDQLHREMAKGGALQEFMLYQMDSRPEYEANIFATEILLDTDEVLELVHDGYDAEQMARQLGSDVNLIALKIAHLRNMGYQLRLTEWQSDFLK
jgi:Zn-dependent peptidase ImmA (M78 family)